MPVALQLFVQYGYLVLFLWVLLEQLGTPLPSVPLLLAAGSLTATGELRLPLVLLCVVLACVVSDSAWYFMGKRWGGSMVRLVCRLSLESATCVRRTEDYFTKHGPGALLVAKFVPGLGTVAAPIAGQTGMKYRTFLSYDISGAIIWSLTLTLSGRFFGDILKKNPGALAWVGHFAVVLFVLGVVGFIAYRIYRQQAFLKMVRTSRLEPEELKQMIDKGLEPYIVDLRHPLDYLPDPRILPGAVRYSPDALVLHSGEIPRDRDVILYCTCPSEATSAKMALIMRKQGIYRVRPLRGGFDGWKKLGFPLETLEPATVAALSEQAMPQPQ